ncbi:MAG: Y-family DNA polymerase [Leptospiraceae bacterium]|nr:Y-family DNA polymerase [Leptospiraceae bacterium]MDW7976273.1 DUF4113 domain-containing protein [Leptospiraceae bacterium]
MSYIPQENKVFGLVDANNFYASCEQALNPKLKNKPVIVLSNNDGCVISRSKEAKALGIQMGQPAFEIRDLIEKHQVHVFSSNFTLYADFSYRFHEILSLFFPNVEVYSVDESFVDFSGLQGFDITSYAHFVRNEIYRWIKIPTCIGIGRTKTLAKLANRYAKMYPETNGVFNSLQREEFLLKSMPIEEVWGIGRKLSEFLKKKGITTAYHLIQQNDYWIRKNLKITGLRMVKELRGYACYDLEEFDPHKKSTIVSRSFGNPVQDFDELCEALLVFCEKLSEKLHHQKQQATFLGVFIKSNPFDKKEPYYSNYRVKKLETPAYTIRELYHHAKELLSSIYQSKMKYKKMGVMALGLVPIKDFQNDLFQYQSEEKREKEKKRNETILKLLKAYNHSGRQKIQFAKNLQSHSSWKPKQLRLSQRYTTNIEEIPIAYIK